MSKKTTESKLENEDWVRALIFQVEQTLSQPEHISFAKNVMQLIESNLKLKKIIKKQSAPIKYIDPDNCKNTWTGRGKKPAWLKEKLDQGFPESQFEV